MSCLAPLMSCFGHQFILNLNYLLLLQHERNLQLFICKVLGLGLVLAVTVENQQDRLLLLENRVVQPAFLRWVGQLIHLDNPLPSFALSLWREG